MTHLPTRGVVSRGCLALWPPPLKPGCANRPRPGPRERGEHAFHAGAFAWISGGLLAQMALVNSAGFVLAAMVLFGCVARGFGSTRPARDLGVGLLLGLAVFLFFVKFLNVSLPAGWLKPVLGTAGL